MSMGSRWSTVFLARATSNYQRTYHQPSLSIDIFHLSILSRQTRTKMASFTTPRYLLLTILALAVCMIPLSAAQTGPQAALIPPCVVRCSLSRSLSFSSASKWIKISISLLIITERDKQKTCDPPAIASVNYTLENQYCHCVRQDGILSNISACAEKGCEEPEKDLFGTLPLVSYHWWLGKKTDQSLSNGCSPVEPLLDRMI